MIGFPRIEAAPDFRRFRDTLLLRRGFRRPPLFDFLIDPVHKSAMLGRPCLTAEDEVAFMRSAGYDYVQITLAPPADELSEGAEKLQASAGAATHGSADGVVSSLEEFRARRWSWTPAAEGDLSGLEPGFERLERLAEATPETMRILLHTADTFTVSWELTGFEAFCLASFESPELIQELMGSRHAAVMNILREATRRAGDRVGAVMYSDDIAYTEGLMLGPEFFAEHLFPMLGEIGDAAAAVEAPLIYHSDGRLYPVFDELAAVGVRGVQPLEPKSMDPLRIQTDWPGRFCLMGNIDLDLMARGEPDAVEACVRERIDRLNVKGGYMPGVSNTVPDYVRTANYVRMIETVYSYPDEAIG